MEPLLDKEAAAATLGISRRHLDYLIEKRRIPFVKIGGRTLRFKPQDLTDWLDANTTDVEAG